MEPEMVMLSVAFWVIGPLTIALLTILFRNVRRGAYLGAAVGTTLAVYLALFGAMLATGGTPSEALAASALLSMPVLTGFWVGRWRLARGSDWLAFLVVPLAIWVAVYLVAEMAAWLTLFRPTP